MNHAYNVSITPGTILKIIVIGAATFALWRLRELALLVLTAIVIASAIEPGTAFFTRYRIPRFLAVLFMYVAVIGSLFGMVYFFFPPLLSDAQGLLQSLPDYLSTLNIPVGDASQGVLLPDNGSQFQSLLGTVLEFRSAFANSSEGVIRIIATFFGGIFSLGLVIVLSFYFAVLDTGVEDFLRIVTPKKSEEYVVDLWFRAKRKIGLWMQGQLLSCLIVGVMVYLGLLLLGIKYSLLLALFTTVAGIVPIFGSIVSAVPAVLLGYSTAGFTKAMFVAGVYIIANQFEAHLIQPLVVNKVVGIPPLLVILALIVGGELAGFLGVVLAIPLAAALREFLNDFSRGKRSAEEIVT